MNVIQDKGVRAGLMEEVAFKPWRMDLINSGRTGGRERQRNSMKRAQRTV